MDFNRFPKEREGEDEDKGNECGGGVGFGGFAKISAIVELKETFFFLSCYIFSLRKCTDNPIQIFKVFFFFFF